MSDLEACNSGMAYPVEFCTVRHWGCQCTLIFTITAKITRGDPTLLLFCGEALVLAVGSRYSCADIQKSYFLH